MYSRRVPMVAAAGGIEFRTKAAFIFIEFDPFLMNFIYCI